MHYKTVQLSVDDLCDPGTARHSIPVHSGSPLLAYVVYRCIVETVHYFRIFCSFDRSNMFVKFHKSRALCPPLRVVIVVL